MRLFLLLATLVSTTSFAQDFGQFTTDFCGAPGMQCISTSDQQLSYQATNGKIGTVTAGDLQTVLAGVSRVTPPEVPPRGATAQQVAAYRDFKHEVSIARYKQIGCTIGAGVCTAAFALSKNWKVILGGLTFCIGAGEVCKKEQDEIIEEIKKDEAIAEEAWKKSLAEMYKNMIVEHGGEPPPRETGTRPRTGGPGGQTGCSIGAATITRMPTAPGGRVETMTITGSRMTPCMGTN